MIVKRKLFAAQQNQQQQPPRPNQMAGAVQAQANATQEIAAANRAAIAVKEKDLPRKASEARDRNVARQMEVAKAAQQASGDTGVNPNPAALYKTPSQPAKAPVLSMSVRKSI